MGRTFENRKAQMAKTNGAKVKLYSKYGKEAYVIAKAGGFTPEGNPALKHLIDKAKKDQCPSHVIEKAIEKAKGGGGEDFARAMYEGYGPGGSMVMVECLTDNPNRTISEVRNCFTKSKAKLGNPGSVNYLFDHVAIFTFKGYDEDTVLEALIMADVDVKDVESEGEYVTVFAESTEFHNVKVALEENFPGIDFDVDEITYEPQTMKTLDDDALKLWEKFKDMLDACDDVQEVYHNAENV